MPINASAIAIAKQIVHLVRHKILYTKINSKIKSAADINSCQNLLGVSTDDKSAENHKMPANRAIAHKNIKRSENMSKMKEYVCSGVLVLKNVFMRFMPNQPADYIIARCKRIVNRYIKFLFPVFRV